MGPVDQGAGRRAARCRRGISTRRVGIQKFINDRSLSDEEIDTIVKWVDAGAPRGDAEGHAAAEAVAERRSVLPRGRSGPARPRSCKSKPWTMPAQAPDVAFSKREVDLPIDRAALGARGRDEAVAQGPPNRPPLDDLPAPTRDARGDRGRAGGAGRTAWRRLVIASAAGDPLTADGSCSPSGRRARAARSIPNNVGKLVMPGTKVEFRDRTTTRWAKRSPTRWKSRWWFYPKDDDAEVQRRVIVGSGLRPSGPADSAEHRRRSTRARTVLQAPAILHNFQPHMHYRGKAQTLEAIYPDGRREVINQVEPLHQHLAHQLHLRSGLTRRSSRREPFFWSRRGTTTRPRTRTIPIRGSG